MKVRRSAGQDRPNHELVVTKAQGPSQSRRIVLAQHFDERVRMALDEEFYGVTGGYFDAKGPAARSPRARNKKQAERLYLDTMAALDINPL